ncbi:hypothetical protein TrLO_g6901 [Triparma laevis f. longispina]|uniref:Nicotinamidase n=1 Tax=Triparma laevis f. longispina TaxID=1714387 RepID=A0A9W7F0H5_9STRA|nr:hypothetical protein TrLO_g6901 [Triparma laevis f. longispina]
MSAFIIIDPQCDFHPGGSLAIPTAGEDAARIKDLLSKSPSPFSEVYVTLDSHHKYDVAHPGYWVDGEGNNPSPFTLINYEDVVEGKWTPTNEVNKEWALTYTKALKDQGSFTLCVWPEHCLIGSSGHNVDATVQAGLTAWLLNNPGKEIKWVLKGQNTKTEMYSCMKAEVPVEDDDATKFNTSLMAEFEAYDKLYVAGQAQSHCVNFTVRDISANYKKEQSLINVLEDCMSNVPGFEEAGSKFILDMKAEGCGIINAGDV